MVVFGTHFFLRGHSSTNAGRRREVPYGRPILVRYFLIIFAKFTTTRKKRRLSAGVSLPKKEGKESVVVRRLGSETQNYWFYRLIMG